MKIFARNVILAPPIFPPSLSLSREMGVLTTPAVQLTRPALLLFSRVGVSGIAGARGWIAYYPLMGEVTKRLEHRSCPGGIVLLMSKVRYKMNNRESSSSFNEIVYNMGINMITNEQQETQFNSLFF